MNAECDKKWIFSLLDFNGIYDARVGNWHIRIYFTIERNNNMGKNIYEQLIYPKSRVYANVNMQRKSTFLKSLYWITIEIKPNIEYRVWLNKRIAMDVVLQMNGIKFGISIFNWLPVFGEWKNGIILFAFVIWNVLVTLIVVSACLFWEIRK